MRRFESCRGRAVMSQDIGNSRTCNWVRLLFIFGWVLWVLRWAGSRCSGRGSSSRRSSPVMALTTRMSRSWTSRMTWVPAWVRPMPMWCSRPSWRRVTSRTCRCGRGGPVVGVGVAVTRRGRPWAGWCSGRRGWPGAAGSGAGAVVVLVDEGVEERLELGDRGWLDRVGRGAISSGSAGIARPSRRWSGAPGREFFWTTCRRRSSCSKVLRPPRPPASRAVNTMPLSVSVDAGIPCWVRVSRKVAVTIGPVTRAVGSARAGRSGCSRRAS